MNAAFLLGVVLAIVGACVSVPQTVRMLRGRNIEGLSVTSYVAWTFSWAGWAGHSVISGAYPKAASELLGLVAESALLATIIAVAGTAGLRALLVGVGLAAPGLVLVAASGMVWGTVGFAVAMAVFDAVYLIPQIRQVVSARSLAGISLTSYALRALVGFGWIVYGFALGRPEVGGWGYVIGPFATFVFVRVWLSRRRELTTHAEASGRAPAPSPAAAVVP